MFTQEQTSDNLCPFSFPVISLAFHCIACYQLLWCHLCCFLEIVSCCMYPIRVVEFDLSGNTAWSNDAAVCVFIISVADVPCLTKYTLCNTNDKNTHNCTDSRLGLLLSGTETTHHQMMYIYGIPQHINLAHHALKTQVACFNHGLVILVVAKLKRQKLVVRGFRDYCG